MADGGSARGMRGYFYALMTDRRHSPADVFLQGALWVLSLVYGAGVRILAGGYKKKFFFPYRADCKVISIGNITVGGTGKTPASLLIAKLLEAQGRRVAVLIRGYGADEYLMLQEELPECAILSGSDRITNARRAFYDFGADTVILDDGFQHWKIHRDLDIVLLDATNPFGNYRLLPRGILREPPQELTRADIIM
ncbi:MAG: tetraacyldisaccharide 4'-kinase, partial [Candidatus Omnitrophota bacterium]